MKKFVLKDMAGRGAATTVDTAQVLKHFGDAENRDGVSAQEWVKTARMGDDFGVNTTIVLCIDDGGR